MVIQLFKTNLIALYSYLVWIFFMSLSIYGTYAKKEKVRIFGCNSSKTVCFLRDTVKLCFEELVRRNLTTINWLYIQYCKFFSHSSAKSIAYKSLSARKFCKDLQKFATLGRKWAFLIMKSLNIWYKRYSIDLTFCTDLYVQWVQCAVQYIQYSICTVNIKEGDAVLINADHRK